MTTEHPRQFDDTFRAELALLFAWRRDVRRFDHRPVDPGLVSRLLDLAQLSPSVGNSQPWRWINVESPSARAQVQRSFRTCNAQALAGYQGDRARLYATLKLDGLDCAPVQFAVCSDHDTEQGHRLGQLTMPETVDYSVVSAIALFWLAARAEGLGVGWVSILDPKDISNCLDLPPSFRFIAYLCLGWPAEDHLDPELERHGWQSRTSSGRLVLQR